MRYKSVVSVHDGVLGLRILIANYVGTLIAYRQIVFKLEKVYVKNCMHKHSNMCRPPTLGVGGWVGGGCLKQNFRL